MAYTTLMSPADLAGMLHDSNAGGSTGPLHELAVVDCRFSLEDPAAGERAYLEQHIPGAVYAHLDRDLCGRTSGRNGRHPLPELAALVRTFSRFGIDASTQVVAYGAHTDMFPTRLWWLLRWLGHNAVAVLDGGIDRWIAEGRPVAHGRETRTPRTFHGSPRMDMIADADAVARLRGDREARVIDARAPERYRGDVEPIDKAAGHIPGAVNHPFKNSVDASGRMLPPDQVRTAFERTLSGASPDHAVCYCGSGVSACHALLAMEHAGLHGAKLYPGSWSEWSSDPSREIETGPNA